jgi:nucleotide-binding universal stress UspA family protein
LFSLSRILVPIAFSEACHGAVRYALSLASRFGSEVNLLHVVEPLDHGLGVESTPVLGELGRVRRQWVAREIESLLDARKGKPDVRTTILEGDAAREIVRFAHDHQTDLIVMPTHGRGPFRRLLMGSITAKVLHDAECAVWTGVHMEKALVPETIALRMIACAIDPGPHMRTVLHWAEGMASSWGARLALIHIGKAHEEVSKLQQELRTPVEVLIESGEMPRAVSEAVAKLGADLLVIGRGHGPGGLGRLPSKTYATLRMSSCPVVSV